MKVSILYCWEPFDGKVLSMGRQRIALSPESADAARILGQQIRLARQDRKLTAARLAELANVSQRTITLIERGEASVSFGNVLNVAVRAGVPLFDITDPKTLTRVRRQGDQALTLIPSNVRNRKERGVDANF